MDSEVLLVKGAKVMVTKNLWQTKGRLHSLSGDVQG